MRDIIEIVKEGLSKENSLEKYLNNYSSLRWQKNYPIAIVHEQKRVKEQNTLNAMQELYFFDDEGFSQEKYTPKMIEFLLKNASHYIKTTSLIAHNGPQEHAYSFKEKFRHDKWKKLVNTHDYQINLKVSHFDENSSTQNIETSLRDIMRSNKEIPTLKNIAFIWIATVSKATNLEEICKHYFLDEFETLKGSSSTTYICWNSKLKNINMRYFVHTPQ